jgi:hypothetical protein
VFEFCVGWILGQLGRNLGLFFALLVLITRLLEGRRQGKVRTQLASFWVRSIR